MSRDRAKRQRTVAERAGLRWPTLAQRTARSVLRLPPNSRVRSALLHRAAQAAFEAWNRGDFELVPYIDDPAVETRFTQNSREVVGLDSVYYGPEGHCRAMEAWNEAWQDWDAEIDEVIDQGRDQILVIGRIHAVGAASGIELDEWGAVRYTFRDGRVLRVDGAFESDRNQVIEALGQSGSRKREPEPRRLWEYLKWS